MSDSGTSLSSMNRSHILNYHRERVTYLEFFYSADDYPAIAAISSHLSVYVFVSPSVK